MSNNERLKTLCDECEYRKTGNKCPMARKDMCSKYCAVKISFALEDKSTAQLVPTELLIKALKLHGYTGELQKTVVVRV